jgi:tRNA modification GTPase
VLINKADIAAADKISGTQIALKTGQPVVVSAETGQGIEQVSDWLINNYLELPTDRPQYPFLINQRHLAALEATARHLRLAQQALSRDESLEFVAFDTRQAADYLGEITGETTPDDVLNKIFADFCIGK